MITVNGEKVPVNMDTAAANITAAVVPGENTISVRVTSSLCNVAVDMNLSSGLPAKQNLQTTE